MPCEDYKRFTNFVQHVGETQLTSQIESNLKSFFDWGLLEIGAFTNVTSATSGVYGGAFDTLRLVDDPSYTDGQVWEAARKDWVWETGLDYGTEPISISGVYVGGTLYGTGDATYGHHYNYPLGRVVFDTAIATTSNVELNYSFRNVQVYIADQAPWWDEIQYDSFRVDDSTFSDVGSGNWQILANHRVQLPAIVIEAVPRRNFKPYQIASISHFLYQDVVFHILAESRWWRNNLIDIVSLEKDHVIRMYNNNTIADADAYPLDFRGMVINSGNTYPTLVDNYLYKKLRFFNMNVTEIGSLNQRFYTADVRATLEIIMA